MSKAKQKTGGSAQGGPGLKAGVSSVKVHKVSIPGGYKVSPNSEKRGQGKK
jgi:hypothetical protein